MPGSYRGPLPNRHVLLDLLATPRLSPQERAARRFLRAAQTQEDDSPSKKVYNQVESLRVLSTRPVRLLKFGTDALGVVYSLGDGYPEFHLYRLDTGDEVAVLDLFYRHGQRPDGSLFIRPSEDSKN